MEKIELRKLCTRDLFSVMKIISKIGISECKKCLTLNLKSVKKGSNSDLRNIGVGVVLDVADVVLKNLSLCEREIYSFLADLSGKSASEIPELDMSVFTEMIFDVVQKDEFADFFTVVLKFVQGKTAEK